MKLYSLLGLAACAALAIIVTSAANASTTSTATITVKWNTQSINVLTAVTDYTVAGGVATGGTAAVGSYFLNANTGTGTCGAPAAVAANTVDFLNVTPDNGVANKYTDCYFKNAVDVHAFTTDASGYGITVAGTLPFSNSGGVDVAGGPYKLCEISSGAWANNAGAANAKNSNFALAAAPALDNGANTCATAGTAVNATDTGIVLATTAGTGGTVLTNQASPTGSAGADFSGDIELGIPPLAASYAAVAPASVTITYTATWN